MKLNALKNVVGKVPAVIAGLALVAATSMVAVAAPVTGTYTSNGDPGNMMTGLPTGPFTLTSTNTTYSALRFVLDSPVLFSDLTNINVAYDAILGGIGGGAPRLAVVFDENNDDVADSSLEINFGPAGSFVDPTLGPGNSGNLIAMTDVGRYDNSGIGGAFYSDYTQALSIAGNYEVLRLSLIVDSFGGNDREFLIDGINVAGANGVPEPATLALLGLGLAGLGFARRKQ